MCTLGKGLTDSPKPPAGAKGRAGQGWAPQLPTRPITHKLHACILPLRACEVHTPELEDTPMLVGYFSGCGAAGLVTTMSSLGAHHHAHAHF